MFVGDLWSRARGEPYNRIGTQLFCVAVTEQSDPSAQYTKCGDLHSGGTQCDGAGECDFHKGHPTQHHCPVCKVLF
jgi:hypothetical protein